jgi:hypothetical protein
MYRTIINCIENSVETIQRFGNDRLYNHLCDYFSYGIDRKCFGVYVFEIMQILCKYLQVIWAVIRKKEMRTNRNVLIVNLALSNLMLALINIPFLWLPSVDFDFDYPRFFCKFANALPGANIYCSTLTISMMAIDRFITIWLIICNAIIVIQILFGEEY